VANSQLTDAGEIDEASLWLGRKQTHTHFVSYRKPCSPRRTSPSATGEISRANVPWRNASDDCLELITDSISSNTAAATLRHHSARPCGRVSQLSAMRGNLS